MDELIKLIKSTFGDEAFTEEELEALKAKEKELPDDALKAIKGALNILNKYKDDMPDDVLGAIKTLTKYSSYGYPAKKSEDDEPFDVDKTGKRLSKATLEQLQKIKEIVEKLMEAKDDDLKKKGLDKLSPEVVAKLNELEDLKKKEKERLDKDAEDKKKKEIDELIDKKLKEAGIGKSKGTKKGLGDTDDKGEDNKDVKKSDKELWPSFFEPKAAGDKDQE